MINFGVIQMEITIFFTGLYAAIEIGHVIVDRIQRPQQFTSIERAPTAVEEQDRSGLVECINRNALLYFVLTNVSTGACQAVVHSVQEQVW
jgi:hypothetical protein